MGLPIEAVKGRLDTRLLKASRVCLAAVAQRVELGSEDMCRCESGELDSAQRRGVLTFAVVGVREVVGCERVDVGEVEAVAVAEESEGWMFDAAYAHVSH